jgi:flagella basal body P-ring formation protein FlgA
MTARLLIALGLAALATAPVAAAAPDADCLRLELRDEVAVGGTTYRLDEVARLGAAGCAALGGLELGRTPRPGYWAQITRQQIAARIAREWPAARRQIRFTGAERVRVSLAGESVAGARVERVAEEALRGELAARYAQVELSPLRAPADLLLPAGRVVLQAGDLAGILPAKRMAVWIDVAVDGEHFSSVPVWFAVSATDRVVSVTRDLEPRHLLEAGDLGEVSVDVAELGAAPVTKPALAVGQRLVRPLEAGAVLLAKHIEPAPAVQRGAVVDVFAQSGRVVLRAKGVALSDGELEQRILISNPKSGEHYAAVVIGEGHVAVQ